MQSKSYCRGLFCRKTDRHKCVKCGIYACNGCSNVVSGKRYCIDCFVPIEWARIKKELIKDWDDLDRKPDIVSVNIDKDVIKDGI